MCEHQPPCPPAEATDHDAAHTIAAHPEQGWSLLCNGIVLFEDTGELLPNGRAIPPQRPTTPTHAILRFVSRAAAGRDHELKIA